MDPLSRKEAESLLLRAISSHGIPIRNDQVQLALDDPVHGPELIDWAKQRLPEDFLLTVEELSIYAALDASGRVDELAELHDLAEVQAVNEEDIRVATEELRRSTESITEQTRGLRQQQDALAKLVARSGESDLRRQEMTAVRRKKAESEQKRIAAEVDGLISSISFRISDLEQRSEGGVSSAQQTLEAIFQRDDHLLRSLQKLGWELDPQDDDKTVQETEKLRELCMRLIKVTVESVRTRLDTVYLETLRNASRRKPGSVGSVTDAEVKALQEEVESLYAEILPVAQMAVEQEHLEPALQSVSAQSGDGFQQSVSATTYMNECLEVLLEHMELLKIRIQDHKSLQTAAGTILSLAKQEIQPPVSSPDSQQPSQPTIPMSPVRPASPTRRARAHTHTRSNSRRSVVLPDQTPLEALLSSLSVSLPYSSSAGHGDQIRSLAQVLSERNHKAQEVSRSAQDSFESSAIAQLQDLKKAMQLLRDSVLAESPFGQVRLVDGDIEESIEVLGQEAAKLRKEWEKVEGRREGAVKSERKEEIISRWGR